MDRERAERWNMGDDEPEEDREYVIGLEGKLSKAYNLL